LRGPSGSGCDDQFWQTDAVNPGILWESPHPLSIVGVKYLRDPEQTAYITGPEFEAQCKSLFARFDAGETMTAEVAAVVLNGVPRSFVP
jgi:hypothetical protein